MFGCFLGALTVLASVKRNGIKTTKIQLAVAGILAIIQLLVIAALPEKYILWTLIAAFVLGPFVFMRFRICDRLMAIVAKRIGEDPKE